MTRRLVLLAALVAAACGEKKEESRAPLPRAGPAQAIVRNPKDQPRWVEFDHIFITFREHERFGQVRSKEDAGHLARKVHDWATSGTDWDLLKDKYSDDRSKETGRANGPYIIVNDGLRHRAGQIPRGQYAKRVGDICFTMDVGDIRLAEYHPEDCRFGWHIVKRLQ